MKRPAILPDDKPDTFKLVGWKVFTPGYVKGHLYTAADNRQTAANFQRLSTGENPWLRVKAKLGHNQEQRAIKSSGLPNAGIVDRCEFDPADGGYLIDVRYIPHYLMIEDQDGNPVQYDLKADFDRGGYNDGSVELAFNVPDPADPAKEIPGAVLEGISFLGEEQPAVKGLPSHASFSSRIKPDEPTVGRHVRRVRFSEVEPMLTRDEILKKLTAAGIDIGAPGIADKSDDELMQMVKVVENDGFMASMKKKFAAPPPADPPPPPTPTPGNDDPAKKLAEQVDDLKSMFSEHVKRFGAVEAACADLQKLKPDLQAAAAFSRDYQGAREAQKKATVEATVDDAIKTGRLQRCDRDAFVLLGMSKDNTVKFSTGDHTGKTPLEVWQAEMAARPVHEMFSEQVDDSTTRTEPGTLSPAARRMLERSHQGRQVLAAAKK